MSPCPDCRAELGGDMRFCPECGRALAAAEIRDPVKLEINRNRLYMKDRSGFVELRVADQAQSGSTVTLQLESSPPDLLGARGESQVRLGPGGSRVARIAVDPKRAGELLFTIRLAWKGAGETLRYRTDDLVLRVNEPTATAQNLAITIDNSVSAGGDMSAISNRAQSDLGRQILELARAGAGVADLVERSFPDRWEPVDLVADDGGLGDLDAVLGVAPSGEAELRRAVCEVLADGKVTDEEKTRLDAIVRRNGIAPEQARRIIAEVRAQSPQERARLLREAEQRECAPKRSRGARTAEKPRAARVAKKVSVTRSRLDRATSAPARHTAGLRSETKPAPDMGMPDYEIPRDRAIMFALQVESSDPEGMYALGSRYAGKNDILAMQWYRKAADLGSIDAMLALAKMHESAVDSGLCTYGAPDIEAITTQYMEALRWYGKAAERGNDAAMISLAWLHVRIVRNEAEAARWFRKAAEQGHTEAMAALGRMYEVGRGVPVDGAEARKWFALGAQRDKDFAATRKRVADSLGRVLADPLREIQ